MTTAGALPWADSHISMFIYWCIRCCTLWAYGDSIIQLAELFRHSMMSRCATRACSPDNGLCRQEHTSGYGGPVSLFDLSFRCDLMHMVFSRAGSIKRFKLFDRQSAISTGVGTTPPVLFINPTGTLPHTAALHPSGAGPC